MIRDELEFVEWLRTRQRFRPAVALGIGDDLAVLSLPAGLILAGTDLLLEGVHFNLHWHELKSIGRKAVARALSDCAGLAVKPEAILISVALPDHLSWSKVQELFLGMFEIAESFDAVIVGGDTARWNQRLAIDVTVLAVPYPGVDPVTRSGARAGDRLFVTGPLGGSLTGRHLTFTPRIEEARALGSHLGVRLHALMDISDGLSLDLWRMGRCSATGATLEAPLLEEVIHQDARKQALQDGRSPLDHALNDGEDYELLVAADVDQAYQVPGVPWWPLGMMNADAGLKIRLSNGSLVPLEPKGYVH